MQSDSNFFQTNLFLAIVTVAVGLFAFVLYTMRNADAKRRMARIITLEVTNAEAQLRDARNRLEDSEKHGGKKLPEHLYVMPLDSWTSNRHLFVRDFKTNEWEAINEFYDMCQLFDEAIRHNDLRFSKDEQQIRQNVHRATYDFTHEMIEHLGDNPTDEDTDKAKASFFKKRDEMAKFLTTGENLWVYMPSKEMRDVEYILTNINYNLSTSSVGAKLSKMSRRRLWITY